MELRVSTSVLFILAAIIFNILVKTGGEQWGIQDLQEGGAENQFQ